MKEDFQDISESTWNNSLQNDTAQLNLNTEVQMTEYTRGKIYVENPVTENEIKEAFQSLNDDNMLNTNLSNH